MIFLFFHCFRCIINPEAWKPRDFIVVMFPKIMSKAYYICIASKLFALLLRIRVFCLI